MFKEIVFILLSIPIALSAQNFSARDYILESESNFLNGNWEATISAINKALEENINYPILHYRKAISLYNLSRYKEALVEFELYEEENKRDPYVDIYKYYCYYFQELYIEALESVSKGHKYARYKVNYQKPKILESVAFEGANRYSSMPDSIRKLVYFNFNSTHQITHRIRINTQIVNLKQPLYWGNFYQNQFLIGGSYYLGKRTFLEASFHHTQMEGRFDQDVSIERLNTIMDTLYGSLEGVGNNFYLGFSKFHKDWNLKTLVNKYQFHTTNIQTYGKPLSSDTIVEHDTTFTSKHNTMQIGIQGSYNKSNWTFSLLTMLHLNDSNYDFLIKPSANYQMGNWIFYGDYAKIGFNHYAEENGALLSNIQDITNHRFNIQVQRKMDNNIWIQGLLQQDWRTETNLLKSYKTRTLLIGLKMNL